jgi:hypothetical protein
LCGGSESKTQAEPLGYSAVRLLTSTLFNQVFARQAANPQTRLASSHGMYHSLIVYRQIR